MTIKISKFDKAVYRVVMTIPLGQTRSYQWVARAIGSPKSARAVGNALNKNPLAPYVPCHRVIASSGAWGGYAGGLKKKIVLLKKELHYAVENGCRASFIKARHKKNTFIV